MQNKSSKKNDAKNEVTLFLRNEDQLRAYFEQIFKLSKQGKEFIVDLDEVWPLVYVRKDHAVRSLTENFRENVDYVIENQSLPKNGEQKQRGGNNKVIYKITVSAVEWFVARKNEQVFSIYRKVFHKSHEAFKNFSNIEDHKKVEIQKQNSKEANTFHYFNGGVLDVIQYNRKNCVEHTGKRPSEWKEIGKQAGLKSKDRTSGKEVIRKLKPETACSMSFTDNLVKQGCPVDEAIELSKKHALPLFEGMLKLGFTPGELYG